MKTTTTTSAANLVGKRFEHNGEAFLVVSVGYMATIRSERTGATQNVPEKLLSTLRWREMGADEKAWVAPVEYADEW